MPMSPSAAAPSRASVMAWARTSASEWPSRPNSQGMVTPPRISGRPGRDAVNVPAQAGADIRSTARSSPRASFCEEQPRQFHVVGLVILMFRSLPCTTLTSTCSSRSTRLDSSVPVKPSSRAFSKARLSRSKRKTCGRLRQHQALAGKRRPDLVAVHLLDGIHRHDAHDRRAGLGGRFVDHLLDGSGSMNGRTASCTATRSVSGDQRRQGVLHRMLAAVAAFHHATGLACSLVCRISSRTHSISSPRSATTISLTSGQATNLRIVCIRIGAPSSSMNCLRLVPAFSGAPPHPGAQTRGRKDDGDFHGRISIVAPVAADLRLGLRWRGCACSRCPRLSASAFAAACRGRDARARRSGRRSSCRPWSAARW